MISIESIYLFIVFAGFVSGLGAVTVIDLHGFFARRSSYWTEATIRTHKITKPLIWIGIVFVSMGLMFLYKSFLIDDYILYFHIVTISALIINGCFLSFVVSPSLLRQEKEGRAKDLLSAKLQRQITFSFIISFLGWWSLLYSVVYIVLNYL